MENEKYLFVVSGAAGTGKDSVVKALREAHPEIEKTVSATTRSPRPGEQEGVDYYYRTREQFQKLIEDDEVVEHNFYNGNYYGTLKEEVNKRLNAGKLVVLVIDVHGAANIRRMYPGATTVFLLPPSEEELERRLRGRGTETEESIRERLATAKQELAQQDHFAVKLVNNEIGTVQPVEQLGKLLKAKAPKALFHIDAVQGLCRVRLAPKKWNCDLMSVSGHKIGAPKGIGALYVKKGLRLPPLTFGGGQERGMRPGTEAVPNIAAFAKACEIRMAHFDEDYAHVQELADYLKQQVSAELPDAAINGEGDIPHVVNLSMPGCKSEVMLHVLEGDEVYISSGSACSKGKQSGVLKALGLPKTRTDSALRVSFAPFNTKEDVDAFIAAVKKGAKMFRR